MTNEEAIARIRNHKIVHKMNEPRAIYISEALDMAIKALEQESEMGYWIDDNENEIDAQYGRHIYKCSECNEYADKFVAGTEDWWDLEKPNYCPNCGVKMYTGK